MRCTWLAENAFPVAVVKPNPAMSISEARSVSAGRLMDLVDTA